MVGTLARMVLYSKAPKLAFRLLHPVQSAIVAKAKWDFRHARAPRIAAVGAAVVALPVGILIGRMARGSSRSEP